MVGGAGGGGGCMCNVYFYHVLTSEFGVNKNSVNYIFLLLKLIIVYLRKLE